MKMAEKFFWLAAAVMFCSLKMLAAGDFDVTSMQLQFRTTPIQRYENASNTSKVSAKTRWLVLYSTFVPHISGNDRWYDDVTMEGTAVIVRNTNKKNLEYIVLTGKTRFFTIAADEKLHPGAFYISPKILDRYCGWTGDLKSIRLAKIAFYGKGRVLLGAGILAPEGSKRLKLILPTHKTWKDAEKFLGEIDKKNHSNVIVLRGGLYSKENTPWIHYRYDFYDLIYDGTTQRDDENIKR